MSTWERTSEPDVEVYHPTRGEPAVQATRAAVVLLLLISIVGLLIVTIGGWDALAGMKVVQLAVVVLYVAMLVQALRWSRGSLPVIGALAVAVAILSLVAAPSWFDRDKAGFSSTALSASTLGLVCAVLVPVQLLLLGFALRGFPQGWNVEEERPIRRDGREFSDPRARPA
jgi:uncharacterized membrane protein